MTVTHILLMRHGQTDLSASGLYTSRTDAPLNLWGRRDAAAWAGTLAGVAAKHSPLRRAAETAELAGLNSSAADDLREWDLGQLEGSNAAEYRIANSDWNLFRDGAPGGESPRAVRARADRVLSAVTEGAHDLVALVGHGQFSKVLATSILDLPIEFASRFAFGPARIGVFSLRDGQTRYSLTGWNQPPIPLAALLHGTS